LKPKRKEETTYLAHALRKDDRGENKNLTPHRGGLGILPSIDVVVFIGQKKESEAAGEKATH